MNQYSLPIQNNPKTASTPEEWQSFFDAASRSGMYKGGSEIGYGSSINHRGSMTNAVRSVVRLADMAGFEILFEDIHQRISAR